MRPCSAWERLRAEGRQGLPLHDETPKLSAPRLEPDPPIRCRDFNIGAIGAGFIMADVQLDAYHQAGFTVHAIASRNPERADQVARRWGIQVVHQTPEDLLEDPDVEIVDIAFPPDQQARLVRKALDQEHIRGVLVQKPFAMNFTEAAALFEDVRASGKPVSVNQSMRYDQSMRVLKQLLDQGVFGEAVLATIEMRAVPHWQEFLRTYGRLTLLNMSIHHLDVLRFLFGEPNDIHTTVRTDPRTAFPHRDGIVASTVHFRSGLMAVSLEDVWAGPVKEGFESDTWIRWRVEGTLGLAQGTIGWPDYPAGSPSTLRYCAESTGGSWVEPSWQTRWFPHAFIGVMEQLQWALKAHERPALEMGDSLRTMALVEAGYRSIEEQRVVSMSEFEF